MKAVIYARFSSAGQREESIEGQIRECTRYAESKGYKIIETYADRALSGTNDRRPEFQRMIRDAANFDVVICWKHDRFARNRYDAALYKYKLKNFGVSIEYAAEPMSDGAESIILDSVLEGYAEYYSANLSQNVKRGLYDSALKRLTLGQKCYGLRAGEDGRFELHPEQAPIVKRIFEEYAAGRSAMEIINDLNSEGFRTNNGLFNKNSISRMVSNPKYKGLYEYGDISDPNGIPPIVSEELWNRANEQREKKRLAPHSNDEYILTGKLFCGHCGKMMSAGGGKSHTGKYYQYYQCRTKDKRPVPKDYIEKIVTDKLVEVIHSDEMIEKFADEFIAWQSSKDNTSEINSTKSRINDLTKRNKNMISAIERGIDPSIFQEQLSENHQLLDELNQHLLDLSADQPIIERDMVVWYLTRFREGDVDDIEWRKRLVKEFLQAVFLFDDGHLIIQLNYSGTANTISFDLLSEVDGSCLASSSQPNVVYSNIVFVYGYLLIRS